MKIKCSKCGTQWEYKGKSWCAATCPKCHRKNTIFIWQNLKYAKYIKCLYCGQEFPKKRKSSKYCSSLCQNRTIAPKGGKACQAKHDFSGLNNGRWKGGISKNHYHYKIIQDERYPDRVRARKLFHNAKRHGKITPPDRCQRCGKKSKLHAHHKDYSKPLDVEWYCRPCHRHLHGGAH